jgi:RNA polymerase sigma-70 factor (ECF subfamily)
VHADAPEPASTDWAEIVGLYDALARVQPSAVVELNRAVAVAMRDGPALIAHGEVPERSNGAVSKCA